MVIRTALAHCKVNLGLEVVGVRPDGYHDLRTVMIKLALADTVTITWHETEQQAESPTQIGQIRVSSNDPHLPTGISNLAHKAAQAYIDSLVDAGLQHLVPAAVDIDLTKRVPQGAGLGGGSADAAATLASMHSIVRGLGASRELAGAIDLSDIALRIGSDVPFFLSGAAGLAEGRGERLTTLELPARLHFVCAMPHGQLSTRDVYAAFDRLGSNERPCIDTVLDALQSNRLNLLGSAVHNSLEKAAIALLPVVADVRSLVSSTNPLGSCMTGSGSCVYGLYGDRVDAEQAAAKISRDSRIAWCVATESIGEE